MMGESKSAIYKLIPTEYLPKMKLIQAYDETSALLFANELRYPVIVKPDIGERGNLVEKIVNKDVMRAYVRRCPVNFIVQELVDYPVELGVFYVRMPGSKEGQVTSIVKKDFLSVTGNGRDTVAKLLEVNPRALLQIDFSHDRFKEIMRLIPKDGEVVRVEPIGNHCRGTTFLSYNHEINDGLNEAFNKICSRIDGFHYGRFDLRCSSLEDLRNLKNFKILELNGAGAEPAHIYHPGASLFDAYKTVIWHFNVLSKISRASKKTGAMYWSFSEGMKKLREVSEYNKNLRLN